MLIALYLTAIIAANLLVVQFGPSITIVNAFLFIGLDLTSRDGLHEKWHGKHLWGKMLGLVGAGSALTLIVSFFLGDIPEIVVQNSPLYQLGFSPIATIALASFVAFAGAGLADTVVYSILGDKARFIKINGSNVVSSAVDSFLFPVLAFGLPVLWPIVAGQFIAKVGGGFIWSIILTKLLNRDR